MRAKKGPRKGQVPGGRRTLHFSGSDWTPRRGCRGGPPLRWGSRAACPDVHEAHRRGFRADGRALRGPQGRPLCVRPPPDAGPFYTERQAVLSPPFPGRRYAQFLRAENNVFGPQGSRAFFQGLIRRFSEGRDCPPESTTWDAAPGCHCKRRLRWKLRGARLMHVLYAGWF